MKNKRQASPSSLPEPDEAAIRDEIEQGKRLIKVGDDRALSLTQRIANRFYLLSWKTPIHSRRLKGKYPLKLLAVPQCDIPGDIASGDALRAGYFLFRGLQQPIDTLDFTKTQVSEAFSDHLHTFRWLRDLATVTSREQAAPIAETVMRKWLEVHAETPSEPAWRADNAGWRMLFWTAHAPLILSSKDLVYRSLVLNCLARTARHLDQSADKAPLGIPRLVSWAAVVAASMLIQGGESRRHFGEAGLSRAIDHSIYHDGGIVSRSPRDQLDAIMLLSMLLSAYDARGEIAPDFLQQALNRSVPALLGLTHGDGGLSSWQGAGAIPPASVEAVILASRVRARPLRQARDWGYQRVVVDRTILQIDAAPPPISRLANAGCASTGAIEISDGAQRLVVNCGGAALDGAWMPRELTQALRSTAAHSTLTLADRNSTAILPDGTLGRGVTEVELSRQEVENGSRIELSHDGYAKQSGYTHSRLILISGDGKEIRGEDVLTPVKRRKKPASLPAQIRFHLAPGVEPTLTADSMGALLRIDSGPAWQFRSGDAKLSIEDSLWVDDEGRPYPTQQLVITMEALAGGSTAGWVFKRIG